MKYSLFLLKDFTRVENFFARPVLWIDVFDTLEEAQEHQKYILEETIILPSY
jgi:hypothetical protein